MKTLPGFLQYASIVLSMALAMAFQPVSAAVNTDEVRIIVKRKTSTPPADVPLNAMLAAHGGQQQGTVKELNAKIVKVSSAQASELLKGLQGQSETEYAEVDATAYALGTASDPLYTSGSEWHLAKIQAPAAWDITTGTSTVIVAVVDTGVYASHPDLAGKVLSTGYDFVDSDSDTTDQNGHGTAVAGTISPKANNSLGVVGVTWNSLILPVRVLDADGEGTYSAISQGIIWAADHGARIINLSLGGTSSSQTLQAAITYAWNKQCVVVAAGGNNGNNTTVYPAACTNVVSVAATGTSDTRTSWSSYGSFIDVSAPGENIVTLDGSNGYGSWSGTSFSSPVTAGVFALMASANSSLTNTQLVTLLLNNSDDLGTTGTDVYYGAGRVNAYRSVNAAKNYSVTTDTTAPVVTISSPANNATVSGTVSVSVKATDNVGVSSLQLLLDSQVVAQSSSASAVFSLNTTSYTTGTHALLARAYDAAGNSGTASVVVTVKNSSDTVAPTVSITSPANGTKLADFQKITVASADNVKVTKLEFYINGTLAGTFATPSATATLTWDTTRNASGNYTMQAYAYDAAGNIGHSAVITVTKASQAGPRGFRF